MKRGRKSKAELAAMGQRPADLRAPWQIEQGARCGCRGADDMCPCQNENPWPRPFVDWRARAETAESALAASKAREEALVEGLMPFADFGEFMDSETEGFDDLDRLEVTPEESGVLLTNFSVGSFRRARALISKTAQPNTGDADNG